MSRALLAAALLPALVGCLAATEPLAPGAATEAAPPRGTELADCHEQHLLFTARAEDFATAMPPGFSVATSDPAGALVDVTLVVLRCATAEGAATLVFTDIPVEPPAALAFEGAAHAVPLAIDVDDAGLAAFLRGAGFGDRVRDATISFVHAPGPAPSTEVEVSGPAASSWRTALRASDGEFPGGRVVRFAWDGEAVRGALVADRSPSANVGLGTVAFRSDGAGGAPPVLAGIAHEIRGAANLLRAEAIA